MKLFKPFKHQQEGVDLAVENDFRAGIFFDCGLGKTVTALAVFSILRQQRLGSRLLVLCPLTLIQNAWADDIPKFTDFSFHSLRERKFKNADIYLANYEMLRSPKKFDMIKEMLKQDFMIVLDESSKIKNFKSQTTKKVLELRKLTSYKLCLSGTPAPNDETEYWPQMRFIDDSIFPHKTFYTFRNDMFHLENGWGQQRQGQFMSKTEAREVFKKGFKYKLSTPGQEKLLTMMKPWCIWRKIDECLDMPGKTIIKRKVVMSKEQTAIYREMKNHLVIELNNEMIAAPIILTKLMKLRQITGGFCIAPEGTHNIPNAKIDELKELLEEIGDKQVIIWGNYTHEINVIKFMLGDKARIINGTVNDTYKNDAIADFKSGAVKCLIANPQSIAHGVTLTNCHYQIFYSMSYSYEQFYQAMGRVYRISQDNKCFYYVLMCEKSIDEDIYDVVLNKRDKNEIAIRFLNGRE